jgi:hypothetical protein
MRITAFNTGALQHEQDFFHAHKSVEANWLGCVTRTSSRPASPHFASLPNGRIWMRWPRLDADDATLDCSLDTLED